MDWEAAEKVQKNSSGEYRAMIGGEWVPVEKAQKNSAGEYRVMRAESKTPQEASAEKKLGTFGNVVAGAVRGAGSIGATILSPLDAAARALNDGRPVEIGGVPVLGIERRKAMDEGLREQFGADTESLAFQGGKLGAEVAGTAGVGGALAKGVQVGSKFIPSLAKAAPVLESGGFKLGDAATKSRIANLAKRAAGGASVGGVSAGLVDPDMATTGAVIGGAMPTAVKAAGAAGRAIAPKASDEVAALYAKAKNLGIDIPADRITNSKPMNAIAASLNYVPFSGRAGTEAKMYSQMNRALSRTFGQDSDNVTMALRKAGGELGKKFDDVLVNNVVKVDDQFVDDLVRHGQTAAEELGQEGVIIQKQIETILNKSQNGAIDGPTAYNIKKTLDRIGNRNSNEAFYARELKKSLMGALNRSLGPDEAQAFANVRKQYGNMLELENLAQNGAEGGISIGRLANLKNIGNQDLQDLADIAAQFVKTREAPHGAMQRVAMGAVGIPAALSTGTAPIAAAGVASARGVNSVLNSRTLKDLMIGNSQNPVWLKDLLANPVTRTLPVISANP